VPASASQSTTVKRTNLSYYGRPEDVLAPPLPMPIRSSGALFCASNVQILTRLYHCAKRLQQKRINEVD
jgi:hypothetical protein